ncbi:MAG TPA: hypothetical protein VF015_04805 [Acidimicrobiales bacterium]
MHLTTPIITHLTHLAWLQQDPTDTVTDEDPGTMISDFFQSNTWLTAVMAGMGVVLIVWTVLRTIWISKDEGSRKATSSALKGGLLALLLFSPSLIVDIAVLASDSVQKVASWFFDTVASAGG